MAIIYYPGSDVKYYRISYDIIELMENNSYPLLQLKQLTSTKERFNPKKVIFVPHIMGAWAGSHFLDQFPKKEVEFWFTQIHRYGSIPLEEYVDALDKVTRVAVGTNIDEAYIVGHSAGCPLAAELGMALGVSRDHVYLGAPVYPFLPFIGPRARAVMQELRRSSQDSSSMPEAGTLNYWKKMIGLLVNRHPRRSYTNLKRLAQITQKQLVSATVVSGSRDIISPPTRFTNILVPRAEHNFAHLAPTIAAEILNS
jgi:pimeloyl-ACP methyl ester carboxylesterase